METMIEKDINLFEELFVKKEQEKEILNKTVLENILENEYSNFLVLILKPNYKFDYSQLDMFGKKGMEYILDALENFETKIVDYDQSEDVLKVIKRNLNQKKYVLTLFSDTPLVRKQTILQIIDYFLLKKLCALTFNRGYVFDCEYLKSVEKIYNPQNQIFDEEDFVKIDSSSTFSLALDILRQRIVSYHQKAGVIFYNPKTATVDAEANIEQGVVIKNNVQILGKCIVRENVVLDGATLKNSIVEKNCIVENSILENSVIFENSKVTDYCVIKNVDIEMNSNLSNEKIIK